MAIVTLDFVKEYMSITDTTSDAILTEMIALVEQVYLDIRNVPFDTDDLGEIVYPGGAALTATEMVAFKYHTRGDNGNVTSESMDNYSVTYKDSRLHGFPTSITANIVRYIDGR